MVYLHSFDIALPSNKVAQKKMQHWFMKSLHDDVKKPLGELLKRVLGRSNGIGYRFTELPEFDGYNHLEQSIESIASDTPNLSIQDRMEIHSERVGKKIRLLLERTDTEISHMIYVSCTGYTSPSPLQKQLGHLNKNHIKTTHMYHQGCYAAFPSIRLAAALAKSEHEAIRVLHSELCSLHVQPSVSQAEQIIVQGLFGDGYCAYSVESEESILQTSGKNRPALKLLHMLEERFPDSNDLMTWNLHNSGFVMTLDKSIPGILAEAIDLLLTKMCSSINLDSDFVKSHAVFAIHPGGPKIIDLIAEALDLSPWQTEHSRSVLYDHGNISSATVPHILKRVVEEPELQSGTLVVSFGFGPGLTFFGGIFKKL